MRCLTGKPVQNCISFGLKMTNVKAAGRPRMLRNKGGPRPRQQIAIAAGMRLPRQSLLRSTEPLGGGIARRMLALARALAGLLA